MWVLLTSVLGVEWQVARPRYNELMLRTMILGKKPIEDENILKGLEDTVER